MSLPGWLAFTRDYTRLDGSRPDRDLDAYVEHLLRISPIGTADECADRLNRVIAQAGANRLLLMVEAAGDSHLTMTNILRTVCRGAAAADRDKTVTGGGPGRIGGPLLPWP